MVGRGRPTRGGSPHSTGARPPRSSECRGGDGRGRRGAVGRAATTEIERAGGSSCRLGAVGATEAARGGRGALRIARRSRPMAHPPLFPGGGVVPVAACRSRGSRTRTRARAGYRKEWTSVWSAEGTLPHRGAATASDLVSLTDASRWSLSRARFPARARVARKTRARGSHSSTGRLYVWTGARAPSS